MSQEALLALRALWPAMAVAAALMVLAWRPWRGHHEGWWGGCWAGALALGGGFSASYLMTQGWPGFPPRERWQRVLFIAMAATVIGLIAALLKPRALGRIALGLLAAASAALLLDPLPRFQSPWVWKLGLGAAAVVVWLAIEPLAERRRGVSIPLALCIAFAGASIVILQARLAGISLLASAAAGAAGVMAAVALIYRRTNFAHGCVHVAAALLPALLMVSWFYRQSEVVTASFVLVSLVPLAMWVGEAGPIARWPQWRGTIVRVVAAAVPAALAAALALRVDAESGE